MKKILWIRLAAHKLLLFEAQSREFLGLILSEHLLRFLNWAIYQEQVDGNVEILPCRLIHTGTQELANHNQLANNINELTFFFLHHFLQVIIGSFVFYIVIGSLNYVCALYYWSQILQCPKVGHKVIYQNRMSSIHSRKLWVQDLICQIIWTLLREPTSIFLKISEKGNGN